MKTLIKNIAVLMLAGGLTFSASANSFKQWSDKTFIEMKYVDGLNTTPQKPHGIPSIHGEPLEAPRINDVDEVGFIIVIGCVIGCTVNPPAPKDD
ncbi:exported hypothetical protein [Vibrio nigripulchritudo FTn2]|uniref:hypothetical protein n=1 Tax=Vibrio nigripulchritudo TaxID=28173 RepID=UPI0003B1D506|nr:hypothetical protein [Vibrio nigripulchritudo]CCN40138.1 exported hypothetical protein [Vibrio nigripulchritudo FTn2]